MALPTRATSDDIQQTCGYLATKPTGAEVKDIKGVLGNKFADHRRLGALQTWGLIDQQEDGKWKVTSVGRDAAKDDESVKAKALQQALRKSPAYLAVLERAAHRSEDSLTTTDVASHWHEHFKDQVGDSDEGIKQQAVCFFQLVEAAGLGNLVVGRRGAPTRLSFNVKALAAFVQGSNPQAQHSPPDPEDDEDQGGDLEDDNHDTDEDSPEGERMTTPPTNIGGGHQQRGQGIFIAHGKNKKPLEQLKKILEGFRIPYKVAIDEPNLGRPIGSKIRDIMESCNCAILIFTADEEFKDAKGNTIWRPSENVVYELGASGYLYDNRIVIMKEEDVSFPTNFRDLGYISFDKDKLDAKAMDVLQELIGFGIVKVST
jgi:hypothetical protein